jgi:hypothetical protein
MTFLSRVGRLAVRLAVVAFAAGAVVWIAILRSLDVGDDRGIVLPVAAVLLIAPPAILLLFAFALGALRSIPQRIREAPAAVRQHATEIRRHAGEVGARSGPVGTVGSIVRLWRSVASARELVEGVGPAALLLTPWMLLATAFAIVGAVLEILLGVIGLIVIASLG